MPEAQRSQQLPAAPRPQGRYVPVTVHAGVAYSAGMTPRRGAELIARGLVGDEIAPEQAYDLAAVAARNALSAIAEAVGGTDRIVCCLHMTVFVAAVPGFTEHTAVADGASAALLAVLGEQGTVARAAVGVAGLPSGSPVEVALVAAVDPALPPGPSAD